MFYNRELNILALDNCANTMQYMKLSAVSESLKYVLPAKQELIQGCEGSMPQSTGSLGRLCCSSNETLNWSLGSTCPADWLQFQLPCNSRLPYIAPLWICLCTIRCAVTKTEFQKSTGVGVASGMCCNTESKCISTASTSRLQLPLVPFHWEKVNVFSKSAVCWNISLTFSTAVNCQVRLDLLSWPYAATCCMFHTDTQCYVLLVSQHLIFTMGN